MVFPFLRERIREACKPAIAHAGTEIRTLHNIRADGLGIGLPEKWDYLHGLHFSGAISRFAILRGPLDLNEFRRRWLRLSSGSTRAVYFTPVFGGIIADRWIGQRNAVVIGSVLMSAGHIAMTFDRTFDGNDRATSRTRWRILRHAFSRGHIHNIRPKALRNSKPRNANPSRSVVSRLF